MPPTDTYPTSGTPAPVPAGVPGSAAPQAAPEPHVLTPSEQEAVDTLYAELKPQATDAARAFVLARTPASYQEAMTAKIDADWPAPAAMSKEEAAARKADADSYQRTATPPTSGTPAPAPAPA